MVTVEDLTKTQIVLLTLLVSFITSIATGIITSTLLAQAPQGVTQTIDRVVEQTIEQVAPATAQGTNTVHEVTVVSDDNAVTSAIGTASTALVRIVNPGDQSFYALGVIVSKTGFVISDKRALVAGTDYGVMLSDGTTLPASLVSTSDTASLSLFQIHADTAHAKGFPSIFVSANEPKLGQTVIALEGETQNAVAVGRVLSFDANTSRATTDIPSAAETQGGPLINLSGEFVGMKTSNTDLTLPPSVYTTLAPIKKFLGQ
jgi:hypothetical protein